MDTDLLATLATLNARFRDRLQKSQAEALPRLPGFLSHVLGLIERFPQWTQQELAEATGRDKAQIARALRDLENMLLITRGSHTTDWRARSSTLTDAGQQVAAELNLRRRLLSEKMMSSLKPEEREVAQRLLTRMLDALSEE